MKASWDILIPVVSWGGQTDPMKISQNGLLSLRLLLWADSLI